MTTYRCPTCSVPFGADETSYREHMEWHQTLRNSMAGLYAAIEFMAQDEKSYFIPGNSLEDLADKALTIYKEVGL